MIDGTERPSLEVFDYISGSSGGNLASFLYHFARDTTTDELLDVAGVTDPAQITTEILETIPEKSMFKPFASSMMESLAQSMLMTAVFGDLIWPTFLSLQVLDNFGIDAGTLMKDIRIRSDVKSTPLLVTSMVGPTDFYPEWTFEHQAKSVIQEFQLEGPSNLERVSVFGFPLFLQDNEYLFDLVKKYGYLIPIPAFGSHEELTMPSKISDEMKFDPVEGHEYAELLSFEPFVANYDELSTYLNPFTVEKLLGLGTDLLAIMMPYFRATLPFIMPFIQTPSTVTIPTADGVKQEMAFSDGGYNDFTGVIALVHKKVRNIISILGPTDISPGFDLGLSLFTTYGRFFGLVEGGTETHDAWIFNHIFDLNSNEENQYEKLIINLESLREAGEPMITTLKNIAVVDNPFHGIEGGWEVDLTVIVMMGVPTMFSEQVPNDVAPPPAGRNFTEGGFFTNEELAHVPNIPTTGRDGRLFYEIPALNLTIDEDVPNLGFDLPPKAARMSHILASWAIDRAWDGLTNAKGELLFEGFSSLMGEQQAEPMEAVYVELPSPPLPPNEFADQVPDISVGHEMGYLASLVYEIHGASDAAELLPDYNFHLYDETDDTELMVISSNHENEDNPDAGKKGKIIVVFRGTDPSSDGDWLTNFNIFKVRFGPDNALLDGSVVAENIFGFDQTYEVRSLYLFCRLNIQIQLFQFQGILS